MQYRKLSQDEAKQQYVLKQSELGAAAVPDSAGSIGSGPGMWVSPVPVGTPGAVYLGYVSPLAALPFDSGMLMKMVTETHDQLKKTLADNDRLKLQVAGLEERLRIADQKRQIAEDILKAAGYNRVVEVDGGEKGQTSQQKGFKFDHAWDGEDEAEEIVWPMAKPMTPDTPAWLDQEMEDVFGDMIKSKLRSSGHIS